MRRLTLPTRTSILYVDDEPALLELASLFMVKHGYDVVSCESAIEALALLEAKSFDAVISDYQMPGMDGIAFLQELRSRGDRVPFIIFTGRDREEVVVEALNLGADFYLKKGGDPRAQFAELMNSVDYAVRNRMGEVELFNSEERFQRTLSIIPDMISIHDPQMNILYSNWKGMAAVPENERRIGTKCHEVYRGFDSVCPDCRAIEVLEKKTPFTVEAETEDGKVIDLRVLPILNNDGEVEMFLEWVRDITDLKNTEFKLRESETKYRLLVENVSDIIWSLDREGRFTFVSPSWKKLTGFDHHLVIGESVELNVHPDDEGRSRSDFERLVNEKTELKDLEYRIMHSDGKWHFFHVSLSPILDDSGAFSGAIGIGRDVTEQINAERALRASEEQYRMLLDNTTDIIWSTDSGGFFTYISPSIQKQAGYRVEELIGRNFAEKMHPDDVGASKLAMDQMGETGTSIRELELRFKHASGEWNWYLLSMSPTFAEDGSLSGVIGVSKNIEDRRIVKEGLINANRKLDLLSMISCHDTANKVMAAKGYLCLLSEMNIDEEVRNHLDSLQTLMDDIEASMEFSRLYRGLGVLEPQWMEISKVINKPARSVPWMDVDVAGLELFADLMLDRAFDNLVENSLRHGGAGSIRIWYQEMEDGLHLFYEDDGCGIGYEMKEKIFQKGYGSNTGLGLFLVREILDVTGIRIVENGTPGEGARFEITVPMGIFKISRIDL